ncbi:hypothetical protein GPECTOR_13g733 [Gonium pectorale]|uniref:Uncharacterized protein n=1 Tax=Gonium pectorale TaxID=33097 RepID=A0A150GN00_GONPE|nr:hypothetical protein GPECTOR_13g733 [Gonium pectorale]|eukprot:KXZ51246.1 hypothetical protein GPECTOR_13g733 [Gonium pectorale]
MEFWRLVQRPQRHHNLVVKLMRDLESGYFAVPRHYDVLASYRTEPLMPAKAAIPAHVELYEKPLMRRFLKAYPEAKAEPVALSSFRPSTARRFAHREAQLATQHVGKGESRFGIAEREMAEPLAEMRRRALGELASAASPLEFMQLQEQEQLDAGMAALAAQGGSGAPGRLGPGR